MTEPEITSLHGLCVLFRECWETFMDGGEIDPFDLQEMLARTGLAEWRNATEADVTDSSEYEVGDPILCLTDAGKTVREAGREGLPASPDAG